MVEASSTDHLHPYDDNVNKRISAFSSEMRTFSVQKPVVLFINIMCYPCTVFEVFRTELGFPFLRTRLYISSIIFLIEANTRSRFTRAVQSLTKLHTGKVMHDDVDPYTRKESCASGSQYRSTAPT